VADILGHGNGALKLFMTGGDLSALLVDLSGLQFGNALLSSLGLPKRKPCTKSAPWSRIQRSSSGSRRPNSLP